MTRRGHCASETITRSRKGVHFLWISGSNAARQIIKTLPSLPGPLAGVALAAIQAPVIMMSQNRQGTEGRLRSELDFDVNRRAESEIQARKLNLIGYRISARDARPAASKIVLERLVRGFACPTPGKSGQR
jgi:hypothetical protein